LDAFFFEVLSKTIIKQGLNTPKNSKTLKKYPISKSKGNRILSPGKMGVK
jgi:hypothetical protein